MALSPFRAQSERRIVTTVPGRVLINAVGALSAFDRRHISMPITPTALLRFWDMACSFVFGADIQAMLGFKARWLSPDYSSVGPSRPSGSP
jgi:hypothetical protein